MTDSLEASQAELEALEAAPVQPPRKKPTKRGPGNGPPRDERGRFTKPKAKKA